MKTIIAFIGIAFSTAAYGQASPEHLSFPYNNLQMTAPHQNTAKTTSDMRLLATSIYVFDNVDFVPTDSSYYFYNNASNDYNLKMDYQYDSSANVWVHNSRQVQRFYPNGAIDSTLTQVYLSGAYNNSVFEHYSYDANGRLADYVQSDFWDAANSSWNYFSKYSYAYDANHNIISFVCLLSDIQNPSSWKNYSQRLYTYDPLNRITSMRYQKWNEPAATWEDNTSYTYTYSGDDVEWLEQEWNRNTQSWDNKALTLNHNYPNGNVQYTHLKRWDAAQADFVEEMKLLFSYDGNNAIDTLTMQYWSGGQYGNFSKKIYKNNAQGLPEEVVTKFWYPVNQTWVISQGTTKFHYYYESYTNVNDQKKTSPSVRTFPSPAHQTLSMEVRWEEPQAFIATIADVQGRVWKRWNVPEVKEYKETVDIHSLPEGHYFISINGTKGKATQRFSVGHP